MTLIEEVLLNKNLIHSQEVQDDSIHAIKSLHVLLDLVSENPELVGVLFLVSLYWLTPLSGSFLYSQ